MSAGNGTTTFANAAYTYDAMGRIATVGNSADTLTYSYVPGTGMIASSSWQTATVNTAYTYDSYKRLTNIAVNSANVYGYTLNDKNQRTGATLPDGRTWSYSYDTLGQLTGAVKRDSANTQLADLSYLYDQIGNRTSATENNTTTTYTSNLVNQYTQIASQVPTYDADGNMTSYNGWTYTWNGENRLVAAENSDTRLEFSYDYMGRRLEKKVYSKGLLTLYDWSLEKHRKFVYDGYKLIAEFDALASDTQLASYLWQPESAGLDVPLMRIADNTQTYYIADGNKNIIALKDSSGADVSTYAYTPFGSLENPVDGDENPFRFSSEYADDETGLVYYNYRYYSPQLGRWTKRDPIEEEGGINLYKFVRNAPTNELDAYGTIVIKRDKQKSYGQACFENKEETIKDLANKIGLKEAEASKWLRDKNKKPVSSPKPGIWYSIPNTIISYWGGDMGVIGQIYVFWHLQNSVFAASDYKVENYRVNKRNPYEYQKLLERASANASLQGTYFWGHGNSLGVGAEYGMKGFEWLNHEPTYVQLLRYQSLKLQYAPAHAYIYACESNAGKQAFRNPKDWIGYTNILIPLPFTNIELKYH